jgi:hypothetical protein
MKLLLENWRKLLEAETQEKTYGALSQMMKVPLPDFESFLELKYPDELEELKAGGVLDSFHQFSMIFKEKNPAKGFVPPRSLLDNLEWVKANYPEAFSEQPTGDSTKIGTAKARSLINQMYEDLRSLDSTFATPKFRGEYESALAAINELKNRIK